MSIQPGQIYRSCDPRGGPRIRIVRYTHGGNRAHVVDAATGKRFRQILITALHDSTTTRDGQPRRTGYVLEVDGMTEPHTKPASHEEGLATDPRQLAYDAVYAYLASTTRVPGDLVSRNAVAWRAVHAALDAIHGSRTTPGNSGEGR